MKSFYKSFILVTIIIYIVACKQEVKTEQPSVENTIDLNQYKTLADTIITDVVIKNPDNDEWTSYCLRNLDRKTLVNDLFDLVYSGELTPYNFFTDEELKIDEIKEFERDPEYSRDNSAKIQFEESWNFDRANQKMIKEVHSIMIAHELYNADGTVKGYKPIFKVYLK
jgi:hypothetical protein